VSCSVTCIHLCAGLICCIVRSLSKISIATYMMLCTSVRQVDEADQTSVISSSMSSVNSFTIYTNNRCLVVAASSAEEKSKWITDLQAAVCAAASSTDDVTANPRILYPSLKSNSMLCTLIANLYCDRLECG